MRNGRRFALIVSAFVLLGPSIVSAAASVAARAATVGARMQSAPIRQGSFVTLSGTAYFNATDGAHALYFTAYDAPSGNELWKSDGTDAGTVMVKDILPGSKSSVPYALTNAGRIPFDLVYVLG